MAVTKMIEIDGKPVEFKASAAIPRIYRNQFGRDVYKDLMVLNDAIKDQKEEGKLLLSFVGRNNETIERYYEKVDEGTGTILRNIIEDTLEEYDDLSVNDRVAILLEMIEKVIG
jgi:hypothetical protein